MLTWLVMTTVVLPACYHSDHVLSVTCFRTGDLLIVMLSSFLPDTIELGGRQSIASLETSVVLFVLGPT